MINYRICFFIVFILLFFSCKKEIFSTDENAVLFTSLTTGDSLQFDTVFTETITPVRVFKIFNQNKNAIRVDTIKLYGGDASPYKVNINGTAGAAFTDIYLAAGDSLYVFVNLTIPQSELVSSFNVTDSLGIFFNNKKKHIVFNAVGQNAVHINETTYNSDVVWKKDLPIIIKGNITIAKNAQLTIEPGSRIYFSLHTGIAVNGELHAYGSYRGADNEIVRTVFTCLRKDTDYKYLPGSWEGITFGKDAQYSQLEYVTIENARTAIVDTMRTAVSNSVQLSLSACIIQHCVNGIKLAGTNFHMANTLVANCAKVFSVSSGGKYKIAFSTFAGFGNRYVPHQEPLMQIADDNFHSLMASLDNSVIYGSLTDELDVKITNTGSSMAITNSIYKWSNISSAVVVENSLQNIDPQFLLLDDRSMQYNFAVADNSPAKGFGKPGTFYQLDVNGKPRSQTAPTIGCYE